MKVKQVGRLAPVVLLSLGLTASVTAADSPADIFKREWKGRKVVLVQTLYTIQYPSVGALSPGRVGTRSAAITIVSPEKGTYYLIQPKGNEIADSDPERLLTRVTALTANQKLESLAGDNRRNVTASPAVLLSYKPGERMIVDDVFMQNQWVRLDLNDEFHKGGPHTTSLLIEWPKRVSKEFTERQAIEELIQKFLKLP